MKKGECNIGDSIYSILVTSLLVVRVETLKIVSLEDREGDEVIAQYKCIDTKIIREYELSITAEESVREPLFGITSHKNLKNERNPGKTISGGGFLSNFYKEVTHELIKEKVDEIIAQEKRIKEREDKFLCPITGGKIVCQGSDMGVMDGPTYYKVEGFSDVTWEKWPRSEMWFAKVRVPSEKNGYDIVERPFAYDGVNNTWQEYVRAVDSYFKKPETPEEQAEIDAFIVTERKRRADADAEYDRKVASGVIVPIDFGASRVFSKLIKTEKVTVCPLSPPSGMLFYLKSEIKGQED